MEATVKESDRPIYSILFLIPHPPVPFHPYLLPSNLLINNIISIQTGWGSMDYTVFASIFSVAAPYNGTDPSAFYSNSKKTVLELTTIDMIFLGLAVVVSIVISMSTVYLCFCRRSTQNSENVVYDNSPAFPTPGELNTENNAYAAAVAHSLSADYSRQPDSHYVEPTLVPAGVSSGEHVGVARAFSIGMDPSPRGELDLVPSREMQRAESAEMQRQRDVMQLLDMGFAFDVAEAALTSNKWNKTRAIEQLTRSPR